MDDQKQLDDRWRESLELLGLTDDAPAPAKKEVPPAPVAPPPEVPAIKAYEEPRSIPEQAGRGEEDSPRLPMHHEHDAPTIPMTRDEAPADWEGEFDEVDEDAPHDEVLESHGEQPPGEESHEVVSEDPLEDGPPAAGEEEKPRRGRRRRRRGRRRGGDKEQGEGQGQPNRERAPAASGSPARQPVEPRPARPARDAEPDSRDHRGPRRGNRREEPEPRRPVPAPARHEIREPEPMEVDDFQDEQPATSRGIGLSASDTDFSDWNVPSWQELISSLYRPDR